jgi:histidinol-phosphate aminotransferase
MDLPRPQPGILDIALYVGGAAHVAGVADPVKLSSNENPFGASPAVGEAIRAALPKLHRYPPTDHAGLRSAIGAVHGLDPAQVICGVGSDEVLGWIAQAYAGPGDEVIHTAHGFLMYRIFALSVGATPVRVAERDRRVDVDAILAAVTPRTRIVYVTNPANPTGTLLAADEVSRLADGLPGDVLLVLDGAYAEFAAGFDGGAALAGERPNVVMTRTFSKVYGLGGLRLGWGCGPRAVIEVLNRIRGPFNLSNVQIDAGIAALADRDWVARCVAHNEAWRTWLAGALAQAGVASDPSSANFVLARFGAPEAAEACDAHLQSRGLIVRRVTAYGLPSALRITVGTEDDCRRVAAAVAEWRAA